MEMSRRRDLKCLIVLGATDDNLPMLTSGAGVLSDSERDELAKLGFGLPSGLEERMYREMNILYSTLTLPSRELALSYPGGGGERPSYIVKRVMDMYGIRESVLREEEYMTAAPAPCLELAALIGNAPGNTIASAAREYFLEAQSGAAALLKETDVIKQTGRGRMSAGAAERLYGRERMLSASRVDKYYSCPYAHFLRNGLRLGQRVRAKFDAPAQGVFMHYVLESVAREIKATVGFKNADAGLCKDLITRCIGEYIRVKLYNFENATARFIYLFRRLEENVLNIVLDMLEELKRSDFEPLDFELDFSELSGEAGGGRGSSGLKGIIDRVDGFKNKGNLYLRVVDYKTGKKSFSLSDVFYGKDMQMLIYLFALQEYGGARYPGNIEPAGVQYVPAREVILKAPRNASDEDIKIMRERELRRDGLVLNDPIVLEAMENGDEKRYLPLKIAKDGAVTGDSLASAEQIGLLSGYVGNMLRNAEREILRGDINCSPYYKNDADNACLYCEYGAVCGFDEASGDKRRFLKKLDVNEVWAALRGDRRG